MKAIQWLRDITKKTTIEFWDNSIMTHSSAVAFFTMFSIPAILMIVIAVVFFLFNDVWSWEILMDLARNSLWEEQALSLANQWSSYVASKSLAMPLVLWIILTFYFSTSGIVTLQEALWEIWENYTWDSHPYDTFLSYLVERFRALWVVFFSTLFIVLLVWVEFLIARQWLRFDSLWTSTLIQIFLVLVFCWSVYRILWHSYLPRPAIWIASSLTALTILPVKWFIKLYIERTATLSIYAAWSAYVVLIVWLYLFMIVFLTISCLAKVLYERHHHNV